MLLSVSFANYRSTGSRYWFLAVIIDVVVVLAGLLMCSLGILQVAYQINEVVIYGIPISTLLMVVGLITTALGTMGCWSAGCRARLSLLLYIKSAVLVLLMGIYLGSACLFVYFISDLREFVSFAYDSLLKENQDYLKYYLGCVDRDSCVSRLQFFIQKSFWVSLVLLSAFGVFLGLSAHVSYLMARGSKLHRNLPDHHLKLVKIDPTVNEFELLHILGDTDTIIGDKANKQA
jgi:hypothetical protein